MKLAVRPRRGQFGRTMAASFDSLALEAVAGYLRVRLGRLLACFATRREELVA